MLVLSRKLNERITIEFPGATNPLLGRVEIIVVDIRGDKVRLGVDADPAIKINRNENLGDGHHTHDKNSLARKPSRPQPSSPPTNPKPPYNPPPNSP